MTTHAPATALQLRSLVTSEGTLQLSLDTVDVPEPRPDQVVVRVEAAPINPSDLGLLFGAADMRTATVAGSADAPVVTATIPEDLRPMVAPRVGDPMPVGNEGAGIVVAAGSSDEAQALLGRTVAVMGGAMYSQYRTVPVSQCLALPEGTTPAEGASCFVNPLTALAMPEAMRLEGHTALVHTAAASNLGQMLNRICLADGVQLVNIVRKPEQERTLRDQGATWVCDSSQPTFTDDLAHALTETNATIAFDAIGGGTLAGQVLAGMETAAAANSKEFNRYGSAVHKQVYIYGGLDRGPTVIKRTFGMAWSVGGWLLMPFLERIGPDATEALRQRVAAEVKTTFASSYAKEVSLAEALQPESFMVYGKQATGEKYLINPQKGVAGS